MSPLPAHSASALSNPNAHSVDFLHVALNGQRHRIRNLKPHEVLVSSPLSDSAHVCDAQICRDGSRRDSGGHSRSLPQRRGQRWISDMDEYLAASRLCREEAMACSLRAAGAHWPFAERENRKKKKHKTLLLTCRALNAGTSKSWRGLKKLFSKQFMPFSNRDHRGLHHINTTISKRSLKALNVGGRKMDARIQLGANNKSDIVLGCRKLQGKENTEENGNNIRKPSSIDVEICRSREKNRKLKAGGIKKKVHILLSKASGIALEVCDILNLE